MNWRSRDVILIVAAAFLTHTVDTVTTILQHLDHHKRQGRRELSQTGCARLGIIKTPSAHRPTLLYDMLDLEIFKMAKFCTFVRHNHPCIISPGDTPRDWPRMAGIAFRWRNFWFNFGQHKGPFIATQLNSTRQREQQLTQFVGRDVINKNTTDLAVRCSAGSVEFSWVELSCVAINTP